MVMDCCFLCEETRKRNDFAEYRMVRIASHALLFIVITWRHHINFGNNKMLIPFYVYSSVLRISCF